MPGRSAYRLLPVLVAGVCLALATAAVPGPTGRAQASDPFELARAAYDRGDFGTAREHFQILAEIGQPKAQTMMGHIYYAARAVAHDLVVADQWYARAAAQGEPNALFMHAVLALIDPRFAPQRAPPPLEAAAALDLLRKAAKQGLTEAILLLSDTLADNSLAAELASSRWRRLQLIALPRLAAIAKNDAESVMWLAVAAGQGDAYAQDVLGTRFLHGAGVPKNLSEAYFWLDLASRQPERLDDPLLDLFGGGSAAYKSLLKRRARARSALSAAERTAVEQRLAAWKPTPQPAFGTDLLTSAERAQAASPQLMFQ